MVSVLYQTRTETKNSVQMPPPFTSAIKWVHRPWNDYTDHEKSIMTMKRVYWLWNEYTDHEMTTPTMKRVQRPWKEYTDHEMSTLIMKWLHWPWNDYTGHKQFGERLLDRNQHIRFLTTQHNTIIHQPSSAKAIKIKMLHICGCSSEWTAHTIEIINTLT